VTRHQLRGAPIAPLAIALALAGCGTSISPSAEPSVAGPSASASLSASVAPSAEASASGAESAAPSGQPPSSVIDAYGAVAVVSADDLRVRTWPGTEVPDSHLTTLAPGDEVVLTNGPIDLDGFRWWLAAFDPHPATNFPGEIEFGWIASGPTDDDDRFLTQEGVQCPGELTVHALARFGPASFEACQVDLTEVSGIVETCYEGPLSPFTYEPGWAFFSCLSLRTEGQAAWSYPFFLPPDYAGPELVRGDVVTLTGGLGVDEAAHGPCEAVSTEVVDEATVESVARVWALDCRYRFVVESAEVTGHVELPPLF
jgi:hypothetical protein